VKPRRGVGYSQTMRANLTRERLARGETVFGCGLQVYRSPEICRTFAAAGFDYALFMDSDLTNNPDDIPFHDTLGELWILQLLTDGDFEPFFNQTGDVG